MTKPMIITREQWGAGSASPSTYGTTTLPGLAQIYNKISVHHDASLAPPTMTEAQGKQRMRDHQEQHQAQGWSDIGYHYVIDPHGRIYGGRTIFAPGAHVEHANTGNLGICLMGNFEQQTLPAPQQVALIDLAAWWCDSLDIDPQAIQGHRDFLATACPGRSLYSRLPAIREAVRAKLK